MYREEIDKKERDIEKESKRNLIIILGVIILIVGGVFYKGYSERREEFKAITSEVNVSYVEELDLYIPYPFNYQPIVREFTEIPERAVGRELETMLLDDGDEVVIEGFILGDDEGLMIITLRNQKTVEYTLEEIREENPGIEELKEITPEGVQDKMFEGILKEGEGIQRVERYVRQIGINEIVVDVVHNLEGRSFLDIQHILDGIRRGQKNE